MLLVHTEISKLKSKPFAIVLEHVQVVAHSGVSSEQEPNGVHAVDGALFDLYTVILNRRGAFWDAIAERVINFCFYVYYVFHTIRNCTHLICENRPSIEPP